MRVEIESVSSVEGEMVVQFVADCCSGSAVWKSGVPRPGIEDDVELDFPEVFELGKNLFVAKEEGGRIEGQSDGSLHVLGKLEAVNSANGVHVLRISDSLVLIEVDGDGIPEGTWITIHATRLEMSSMNL